MSTLVDNIESNINPISDVILLLDSEMKMEDQMQFKPKKNCDKQHFFLRVKQNYSDFCSIS